MRQRIKRSRRRNQDIVRVGWAYHVFRWPLLAGIWLVIALEFFASVSVSSASDARLTPSARRYVAVRQIVNLIEWWISCPS